MSDTREQVEREVLAYLEWRAEMLTVDREKAVARGRIKDGDILYDRWRVLRNVIFGIRRGNHRKPPPSAATGAPTSPAVDR